MSFGRKGLVPGEAPQYPAPNAPTQRPQFVQTPNGRDFDDHENAHGPRFDINDRKTWIFAALGMVIAIISLDDFFAHTSMITPINSNLVWVVTAICAVVGLVMGVWYWLTSENAERGIRATLGIFLGIPLMAGAWGHVTVWRMAEHVEFDFANSAWQSADYPITGVHEPSRKRPFVRSTISIDPYDAGSTDLPIPDSQLDELYYDYDGMCVTVQQRTSASGAIQIRTAGSITGSEPPPQPVHRC